MYNQTTRMSTQGRVGLIAAKQAALGAALLES